MTEYAAGTVAEVTWDDASLAAQKRGESNVKTQRAIYTDDGYWALTTGHLSCIQGAAVTDVRPLVVLDLEEIGSHLNHSECASRDVVTVLRHMNSIAAGLIADQIEAQTKPPRIPEPGLWGVVEANTRGDSERRTFGHIPEYDEQQWAETGRPACWFNWNDLVDPVLVRPGIEDES